MSMPAISEYSSHFPMENGSAATLFSRLNEEPKDDPKTRETTVEGIKGIPARILGFTSKEITDIVLQVFGAITASVFGVWAIKSYDSANVANGLAVEALQQSLLANKMTLASLCLGDQFSSTPECARFLQEFSMPSIILAVVPSFTTISVTSATSVIATLSSGEASSTPSPIISTIFPIHTSAHSSITFDTTKSSTTTNKSDTFSTINFISLGSSNTLSQSLTVSPVTTISSISASSAGTDSPRSTWPPFGPIDTSQSDNSSFLRKNITLSFGGLIGVIVSGIILIAIMGMVLVGRRRARMLKLHEAAL